MLGGLKVALAERQSMVKSYKTQLAVKKLREDQQKTETDMNKSHAIELELKELQMQINDDRQTII